MTMTIHSNQQRLPLNFDMPSYSNQQPQFTNPWVSSSSSSTAPDHQNTSQSMYLGSQGALQHAAFDLTSLKTQQQQQQQHQQHQQQPPPQSQHPPLQAQPPSQHHHQHQHQTEAHHQHPRPSSQQSLPPAHAHPRAQQQQLHPSGNIVHSTLASYNAATVTAGGPPAASAHSRGSVPDSVYVSQQVGQRDLLSLPQDSTTASYVDSTYTAPSPIQPVYASSTTPYDQMGYAPAPMRSAFAVPPESDGRRFSQSRTMQSDDRRSFADAIEASHGILSLSQDTPRPIYGGNRQLRGSGDSYGFPSTHSTNSSVSSTSFSGYYAGGGSIDSSVSDYSTGGSSDMDSVASRTLPVPRPQGYVSLSTTAAGTTTIPAPSQVVAPPPAPQSMMSQFSSKMTNTVQKKHKCKVCDKRFTRPSSLQTHMYSHTGEKR
ncbi:Zinc finger, C2H2-type/integrase, DNA-binding protein [Niveomyces insectorum RCEF 264]|uniref:Zinc finger, C2H2-type/integrase, DNA-binding protein n=1 Tax=Niveomyces insectorum RCEF 264 TaxID=1081102 RepID=A0A162J6C8_9HYPO|nr:Zinc finger, C2H2-type/integrase, DNA-binding protein [Niveomyces insectorum RCEF 264]